MTGISLEKKKFYPLYYLKTLVFIICILGLLVQLYSLSSRLCGLTVFFLFPSALTILLDRNPYKYLSKTVLCLNLCGLLIYMPEALIATKYSSYNLWLNSLPTIKDLAIVYGYSLMGLILYIVLPVLFLSLKLAFARSGKNRILRKIEKYKNRWYL